MWRVGMRCDRPSTCRLGEGCVAFVDWACVNGVGVKRAGVNRHQRRSSTWEQVWEQGFLLRRVWMRRVCMHARGALGMAYRRLELTTIHCTYYIILTAVYNTTDGSVYDIT